MNYPEQPPGHHPQNRPPQQGWPQQPQYAPPPQQPQYPPQQQQPQYPPPQQRPPYAPPQQQHYAPQPQHYAPQPQVTEGIAITTQYMPLAFMMAMFKPKILVDGYEGPPAMWGRNVVPARPGQHRVHVHVPYWLPPQIGPADTLVEVYPGQLIELEYKAPVWSFSAGSLGASPQNYNGVGVTLAVMAAAVVLPLLFMIMMVLIGI